MTSTIYVSPFANPAIGADVLLSIKNATGTKTFPGPIRQALDQGGTGVNGRIACPRKVFIVSPNTCVAGSGSVENIGQFLSDLSTVLPAIERLERPAAAIANMANDYTGLEVLASFVHPELQHENHCSQISNKFDSSHFGVCATAGSGTHYLKREVEKFDARYGREFGRIGNEIQKKLEEKGLQGEQLEGNRKYHLARIFHRQLFSTILSKFVIREVNEFREGEKPTRDFGGFFEFCAYDRAVKSWQPPSPFAMMVIRVTEENAPPEIELAVLYDQREGGAIVKTFGDDLNTSSFIGFHPQSFSADHLVFDSEWTPHYLVVCVVSRGFRGRLRFEEAFVEEDVVSHFSISSSPDAVNFSFSGFLIEGVARKYFQRIAT